MEPQHRMSIALAALATLGGSFYIPKIRGEGKENCAKCNKQIPPGKAGRLGEECRKEECHGK